MVGLDESTELWWRPILDPTQQGNDKYLPILLSKKYTTFTVRGRPLRKSQMPQNVKKVPIAFILPSRWRYGAEGLGIETTSCL